VDVFATKDQGNAEPQRFWNREDAKGAKGFIYFLIGTPVKYASLSFGIELGRRTIRKRTMP